MRRGADPFNHQMQQCSLSFGSRFERLSGTGRRIARFNHGALSPD
jgi:hypothetical protein